MKNVFQQIKLLAAKEKFGEVIDLINKSLRTFPENAHLWNLKGDFCQLVDSEDASMLVIAEQSYLRAFALNSDDLESIEALAHFYDAVLDDGHQAAQYAELYVCKTKPVILKMRKIISDHKRKKLKMNPQANHGIGSATCHFP